MSPKNISIIHIPSDIGSLYPGKSRAPAAFTAAGFQTKLQAAGHSIVEYNAFSSAHFSEPTPVVSATWKPSSRSPNGARNEAETVKACHAVKNTVALALANSEKRGTKEDESKKKNMQFFIGGECLYTPAILSAYWHHFNPPSPSPTTSKTMENQASEQKIGIIYMDADTDLYLPNEPSTPGTLASMTLSHLTLRPGSLPSMAPFSRPNNTAVVTPQIISLFGTNATALANGPPAHLSYLLDNHFRVHTSSAVQASPVACAKEALAWIEERVDWIVLHLDVDVINPGSFALANVPNFTGLGYRECLDAFGVFLRSEKVVGVSVAEVNPDHDCEGEMVGRLVGDLVGALGE
ncbi:unnamed protein product [Periconia digitata]|uniref:Arginase/deacetylase n=1 Tax=Periconia digitata TaxID=1303443 RepID=A0A9W4UAA7_9PLEO|nr:unnamed protein product [Periconia digitata]